MMIHARNLDSSDVVEIFYNDQAVRLWIPLSLPNVWLGDLTTKSDRLGRKKRKRSLGPMAKR